MGVSVEQWRQRIGTFSQPVRCPSLIPTLKLNTKYISLSIRTALFLILVTQGVESNPGPTPGPGRGRGRERDSWDSRRGATCWDRRNRGYGRGSGQSDYYAMQNLVESVRHKRRITRSQSERTRQPEIT